MPIYRVKPGMRFGARNQYGPTDNIELSVGEAAGFLDKLELVEDFTVTPEPDPWGDLETKIVDALIGADIETPEQAVALSDEELLAIDGIGPKAIEKIRSSLGGNTG